MTWDYNPTAALFPRWVAIAAIVFLLCALAGQKRGAPRPRAEQPDEDFPQVTAPTAYWPTVLALQAAYILGIYLLGFTIATLSYLIAAPVQMRYRHWLMIALQAIVLTVIISGSFVFFFHARLPKGILWSLF